MDINTEGREKNLERPGEKSVTGREGWGGGGGGRRNGRSQASHRWPITPDNKHNLILYSFHLALRRGNPSPGIISAISSADQQHTYDPAHTDSRRRMPRAPYRCTRTHIHSATLQRLRASASSRDICGRLMRSCATYLCLRWLIPTATGRDCFSGGPPPPLPLPPAPPDTTANRFPSVTSRRLHPARAEGN